MKGTHPTQEQLFWDKLDEYRQAYRDYEAMCYEQRLEHGKFPFCLCWPGYFRKAFIVSLIVFMVGISALAYEFWRALQGGFLGRMLDSPNNIVLIIITLSSALVALRTFFPDGYYLARQSYYSNLLYIRSRNEKSLAKLERALAEICAAVAPYREQKRLEAEQQQNRIAEENRGAKEKYLKCFQALWMYLRGLLDLHAEDFDVERIDDKFSSLFPGSNEAGDLVWVEFPYSEEGLNQFISRIVSVEVMQTRKHVEHNLRATVDRILSDHS